LKKTLYLLFYIMLPYLPDY